MRAIEKEILKTKYSNILVPDEVNANDVIRGVYGIFSISDSHKICLYIGRSYNISERLFGSGGHVTLYNYSKFDKNVPKLIKESLDKDSKISIQILDIVDYIGDNYFRDMQRLAYAEMQLIEEYQIKGECLNQLPEGTWISEKKWTERYSKK